MKNSSGWGGIKVKYTPSYQKSNITSKTGQVAPAWSHLKMDPVFRYFGFSVFRFFGISVFFITVWEHCMVQLNTTTLMLIGGTNSSSFKGATDETFFLNFQDKVWVQGPSLKEKRCHKVFWYGTMSCFFKLVTGAPS